MLTSRVGVCNYAWIGRLRETYQSFYSLCTLSYMQISMECVDVIHFSISGVTMAYTLSSETSHVTPGPPLSAEGEPANLIDASSPVQLYRTA